MGKSEEQINTLSRTNQAWEKEESATRHNYGVSWDYYVD